MQMENLKIRTRMWLGFGDILFRDWKRICAGTILLGQTGKKRGCNPQSCSVHRNHPHMDNLTIFCDNFVTLSPGHLVTL